MSRPPPPGYVCHRCFQPGLFIRDCPTKDTKGKPRRMRRASGIPQTFLMEIDDPNMRGAMVNNYGKLVIPIINALTYATKKNGTVEPPSSSEEEKPVWDQLLCLLCKDTMVDAAIVPCCGNSFCDEYVRSFLLHSKEHKCPVCYQIGVSPNNIIANKSLRQLIEKTPHTRIDRRWTKPASSTVNRKEVPTVAPNVQSSPTPPGLAPKLKTILQTKPTSFTWKLEFMPQSSNEYQECRRKA